MPIITYNTLKIYNSKEFKHAVRRASKLTVERNYKRVQIQSKAIELLLKFPGVIQMLKRIVNVSCKIIAKFDKQLIINSKEEQYVITK